MDGYEKLAQPYSMPLYIYGIIDTFSRKVLSVKVLPDKKKRTIAKWLMSEVLSIKGMLSHTV